ncbi:unnamed protein product, partial [Closterium sp. NIES-54]
MLAVRSDQPLGLPCLERLATWDRSSGSRRTLISLREAESAGNGAYVSAELPPVAGAETGAATGTDGSLAEGAGAGGGGQAEDPRGGLSEAEWMALAEKLRGEGDALLKEAAEAYERRKESSSDARWLAAVRRSGTAADRVAALTVVIQDDPVANLTNLDALLAMVVNKATKRHALGAMDALSELFTASLLPDSRKLRWLHQQPLLLLSPLRASPLQAASLQAASQQSKGEGKAGGKVTVAGGDAGRRLLRLWRYEECLKERFERFLEGLEEGGKDVVEFVRDKVLRILHALLSSKAEGERRVLQALVNK